MNGFRAEIGIQQRVLAAYRVPFFDQLASAVSGGLQVFAGQPLPDESIAVTATPDIAGLIPARNLYFRRQNHYGLCWQLGLFNWLTTWKPDVLIVEANPRIFSSYFGVLLMKHWRRPVIGWGLGVLERSAFDYLHRFRHQVRGGFLRSFDALIAYSNKGARDYEDLGVPKEKIFIAYNSIENDTSNKYLTTLSQNRWESVWRQEIGLDPQKSIVLYVGRLTRSKKVHKLIEACAQISMPFQLLVVGDGPERENLEQLATSLQNRVVFAGAQFGIDLARCFVASSLFVLPGSGGLALHHAMSYGKPVLVSSGDGTEEDLVEDGKNGLYFKSDNIDELSAKIEWLLSNSDVAEAMGKESLRIVQEKVNMENMVAKFIEAVAFVSARLNSYAPACEN